MGGVPRSVCCKHSASGHLTRSSLNPTSVNYTNPVNMEVMPSKSVSNLMMEGRFTKTSRFFQLLIKTCFIPISVKNNKIVFKVFSLKMLVYILCAVLWNIFTQTMMVMFMKQEDFDRFFSEVSSFLRFFCCPTLL